jgi:hypothetical protein
MPRSLQVNSAGFAPNYKINRAAHSGPILGPYAFITIGPQTFAATERLQLPANFGTNKGFHPIAIAWGCESTGTAADMGFGTDTDATGALTSLLNASIDLIASPTGIAYLDNTTATNYIVRSSVGDPGVTAAFLALRTVVTAATVTNLCVTIVGVITQHVNTNTVND